MFVDQDRTGADSRPLITEYIHGCYGIHDLFFLSNCSLLVLFRRFHNLFG